MVTVFITQTRKKDVKKGKLSLLSSTELPVTVVKLVLSMLTQIHNSFKTQNQQTLCCLRQSE